ncbi:MAG: S41 family peptidase [Polyangiaceae bacterium]|nr:S41 family peptidase [Polyangiaceae bacterium]
MANELWRRARTLVCVGAAFAGGALSAGVVSANNQKDSPYAPLDQMARVLVLMENQYVDAIERDKIVDGAIKGMVAELDPHSAYMDPQEFAAFNEDTVGSFGGVGVEVDFRDDAVTVIAPIADSPAARAGIQSGDKILAVDGTLVRGMPIDKIVRSMRGPLGTHVKLTVKRATESELMHFDLVREAIHVRSVDGKRLASDIGYLRLKQFQSGTHEELLDALAAVRKAGDEALAGLLLDLRDNPGGLIDEAAAVADEFLSSGIIFSTRHRGEVVEEVRAHLGGALVSLPVVVLVNEYSASSAELVSGALQDNLRAKVVGARTFGKGSVQTIYELPSGAGMRLTTMRYYTPNGRSIQVSGIAPDVVVKPLDGGPAEAYRESSLEGHLAGAAPPEGVPGAPVLRGGTRPRYTRIDDVPVDPSTADDYALSVAYSMLKAATPAP